MGKYRVLHPLELPKKMSKINPQLQETILKLCEQWLNSNGRPMYVGKKVIHADVIKEYESLGVKSFPKPYLRKVISGVLIRDCNYSESPGISGAGNTLWRVDDNQ